MVRTCSNCGVATPPEARFCRHCGAPLRTGASFEHEPISPLAQTVPLSGEGHTTNSLGTDETGRHAPETKRVRQSEIEHLLRRTNFEAAPDSNSDGDGSAALNSDYAAPQTGELVPKQNAPAAAAPAPASSTASAARDGARTPRSWVLMTGLLLLATLSGALLAYYFLRQRAAQSAGETVIASNSNQAAEQTFGPTTETANVNAPAVEAETVETAPQPQESPTPAARPSASVEPSRDARTARQEREREKQAPAVPLSTPSPAPTVSPAAQTQPTPAPSPVDGGANGTATQANSDAFYFQAVNIVNGREPRLLKRAELLRALQLFQNVTSGPHSAEARRQAARLGRELDRLDKQSQR